MTCDPYTMRNLNEAVCCYRRYKLGNDTVLALAGFNSKGRR